MTHWFFDAGAETWDVTQGFAYDAPNLCLTAGTVGGSSLETSITGLSVEVQEGDPISAQFRVTIFSDNPSSIGTNLGGALEFRDSDDATLGAITLIGTSDAAPYDSGWMFVSGTISTAGTVENARIAVASDNFEGSFSLDTIYLDEFPAALADRRYLGIDADFGHIYLTSITGGSVTYNSVTIGGTAFDGTATFGAADYADPDTFTKGLYPVIRPGVDSVLYLRGRDGNSKQTWYNDLNGTVGWVDIGPGTATWGTAKFAVALMPDQLNPFDVIVAFSDNDVYRTEEGTSNWVKQGDAPSGLRCAARLTGTAGFETFLAGGTAAGTAWFTQNMGVSFTGGGTAAGTINAIEVSR